MEDKKSLRKQWKIELQKATNIQQEILCKYGESNQQTIHNDLMQMRQYAMQESFYITMIQDSG